MVILMLSFLEETKVPVQFYARNHTRYQRIMAINHLIEFKTPQKVKDIVISSMTLSGIGNTGHYQGGMPVQKTVP